MPGLFIVGTDTGIGKTYVSTLLIKLFAEQDLKVIGMKPISSGAKNIDGILQNDDALSLIKASNADVVYKEVNPYVFEPPISPHLAAEQKNIKIDFALIKQKYNQLENKSDIVIVESVGGWYSPLSMHTTVADLAETLSLPIILVVGLLIR